MVICYLGGDKCMMCSGPCCSLVNSVINVLVEEGELDPDAEVIISLVLVFLMVVLIRTSRRR